MYDALRAEYSQGCREVLLTPMARAFCEYTAIRERWGAEFGGPLYAEAEEVDGMIEALDELDRTMRKRKRRKRTP